MRPARRAGAHALASILVAVMVAATVGGSQAATSAVTVSLTVPSEVSLDTTGCATGAPDRTQLPSALPGSSVVTSLDCVVGFSSSNDTASLRVYQADGGGNAMWRPPVGPLEPTVDGDATMAGFPGNGAINTAVGTGAQGYAAGRQADGKLVVAGFARIGTNRDFALARYDADGTLDVSFDGDASMPGYPGNGIVTTEVQGGVDDQAEAIALMADGRIVLAGYNGPDIAIARYNGDGTLDTTFGGGDGKFTASPSAGGDRLHSVHVLPDGGVMAAGYANGGVAVTFFALKLLADGSHDLAFDGDASMPGYPGNGQITTAFASPSQAYASQPMPDGDLIVLGHTVSASAVDVAVARYNADGTLDVGFDGDASMPGYPGNGKVTTAIGSVDRGDGSNKDASLALQGDGKIVAATARMTAGEERVLLARYNGDGTLDASFDGDATMPGYPGNGVVVTVSAATLFAVHGIAEQADGGLVAVSDQDDPNDAMGVYRYRSDGTLDTAFSGDGKDLLALSAGDDAARAVVSGEDGRLLVTGKSQAESLGFVVYDTERVADWVAATTDWSVGTNMFGACLSSSTNVTADWTPAAGCPLGTPAAWRRVVPTAATTGSRIATSVAGAAGSVNLRFGMRMGSSQPPGQYVAPIVFEAVAPAA